MNNLDITTINSLIDILADGEITKTDAIRQLAKQQTVSYTNIVDQTEEDKKKQ